MEIKQQVAALMQGTDYGDDTLRLAMEDDLRERLKQAEKAGRPLQVYCGYDPTKPDGTPRKLVDVEKINATGWQAEISLREGIADTYQWYMENYT